MYQSLSMSFATPKGNAVAIIKRAFWLAYVATCKTSGLGRLRSKNDVTEEDVWKVVKSNPAWDYARDLKSNFNGDYIFNKSLKLELLDKDDETRIAYPSEPPNIEYHGWAFHYDTYEKLLTAASLELEKE